MKIGNGEFWLGDCLGRMKEIPDGSVDMVVTSPPYDDLRTYNGSLTDWCFETFVAISDQLIRTLREGGVIVWNVGDATIKGSETGSSFRQVLSMMERGMLLADTMIWVKDGGGAIGSNKLYTQNFEYMFVLSKGKHDVYNLIRDRPNQSVGQNKSGVGRRKPDGSHKIETRKPVSEFSKRNNWWYIPPERGDHPAVFPVALAHDHILSWSNPNDLILDPFGGSGTTAVAAERTGRRWLCIEREPSYYYPAVGRVWSECHSR